MFMKSLHNILVTHATSDDKGKECTQNEQNVRTIHCTTCKSLGGQLHATAHATSSRGASVRFTTTSRTGFGSVGRVGLLLACVVLACEVLASVVLATVVLATVVPVGRWRAVGLVNFGHTAMRVRRALVGSARDDAGRAGAAVGWYWRERGLARCGVRQFGARCDAGAGARSLGAR